MKVTCAVATCTRAGVRDIAYDVWTPAGNQRIEVFMCDTHSQRMPDEPNPA